MKYYEKRQNTELDEFLSTRLIHKIKKSEHKTGLTTKQFKKKKAKQMLIFCIAVKLLVEKKKLTKGILTSIIKK